MAKFVTVSKAPDQLRKDEYVIEMPDFLDEIRLASARNTRKKGQLSPSFLRSIAISRISPNERSLHVLDRVDEACPSA